MFTWVAFVDGCLCRYVNSTRHCFSEQVLQDVMDMVSANIFRPLPPCQHRVAALLEPEEEEPQLDSSWPHIQIVYDFFLRFIVSNDVSANLAKKFVDQQFVLKVKMPYVCLLLPTIEN